MAPFLPSDATTSIMSPSFVDDGLSFSRRMPRSGSRWDIDKWLEGTSVAPSANSTTDTSGYTGSFLDDGADMLAVDQMIMVPGFGRIDKRFYRKGKRGKDGEVWTEDMARAVGGDIRRSLREIGGLGDVKVVEGVEKVGRKSEGKERGTGEVDEDGGVWVKAPLDFGAFVIEDDDKRIIIVERDGEYDSGRPEEVVDDLGKSKGDKEEEKRRKREEKRKKEGASAKWNEESSARRKRSEHKKSRCRRSSTITTKPLKPIPEADTTEHDSIVPPKILSFTNFFVTGGVSGWPSPVPSPPKPPASPTRSPPGAWPSPVSSPVKQSSGVRWGTGSATRSAHTSTVEPVNTWKEEMSEESISTTRQASAVASYRSRSKSSYRSRTHPENGWEGRLGESGDQDSTAQSARSPTKPVVSRVSSRPGSESKGSWTRDVEEFFSHASPATVISRVPAAAESNTAWDEPVTSYSTHSHASSGCARSRAPSTKTTAIVEQTWDEPTSTHSSLSSHSSHETSTSYNTPSFSAWNAPSATEDTRCTNSWPKSAVDDSQVSTIQPYSWRRDVEEQSTYSTNGSSGSRSNAGSITGAYPWPKDGEDNETWKMDTDTRSVRSGHSTYHHSTVEDAPPTPAEVLQEWGTLATSNTGWGDQGMDAATGITTAWNGSHDGSNGSAKSRRDKSGYSEENETWLNSELGGMKFREAEWRRPGAISWRDV